jgi:DNA (cytosine-5)-methyltransferase 1
MTHGSLFSGIGGFDLAAEWMGWENKFHCEWNEFGQKVLKYYWPEAESFSDITKTNFSKYANRIDILTGGFPCQPYSMAGKRKGKDDERHLWPEMLRAIREIKPRWIVGENVLGLVNWSGGLVFHEVQTDLEAQGYEVFPYVLPAVSVNAPHRRDRVWFVAYSTSNRKTSNRSSRTTTKRRETIILSEDERWKSKTIQPIGLCGMEGFVAHSKHSGSKSTRENGKIFEKKGKARKERNQFAISIENGNGNGNASNTSSIGFSTKMENGELERRERFAFCNQRNKWDSFPTVFPLCSGDDGLSDRLDSITFSKWRRESIKAGGNAIVPQVAFQIFKTIKQYDTRAN